MKLSCSAIAWGQIKDVPTFRSVCRSIKDAGYTGVGIEYNLLPEEMMKKPELVRELATEAGLAVPSMAINENTPYQAEAAARMGAESGWLCLFEKDAAGAAAVTQMHLREFGKRGLKVALHPHVRSNVESDAQLDDLIERCRPATVDVCFDSAHQKALNMDLPRFIRKYKDRMALIHLKDLRAMVPPEKIDYDHDFVDLGEGVVDFRAVMDTLKEVKYGGWLMLEVDFAHKITVEESVMKNFEFLSGLM
ncbi:MAG: sugar phosphate isomerase/epimerase [Thaumarchaeota archaeon]|nr:sugar phosphate isomerase/epimerase [Nitrososphaerota archaeon]